LLGGGAFDMGNGVNIAGKATPNRSRYAMQVPNSKFPKRDA
jgi:hypothetical protein